MVKSKPKSKLLFKQEKQFLIQEVMKNELTPAQEDFIIESELENIREAREYGE